MATERSFPDSHIDDDPQQALEGLTKALQGDSDNAELLCQRAYAYTLLNNYTCAVEDAKKAQQLNPGLPLAFMRTGIAEYHLSQYESAHAAFTQGYQLDGSEKTFEIWIKRCEEMLDEKTEDSRVETKPAGPNVKYDWYQTESQVIVTVMAKNVPKDGVSVKFMEQEVEMKMKKTEAIRWESLEGEGQESNIKHFDPNEYPTSSQHSRKWDKIVVDISEEEKNEKLEGDAALNKVFQQIYTDGSDEIRRAMNKSFTESHGTVLSTNWKDVGKRKVDPSPPDDVELRKY
ncbi:protein SGT1 homolog isoform X4 [Nerophis ophidion]|uniref:protein SGT1 homolog isoform X4 n=1 Tax=Nerophis ophidion TaxID=159077 RepID=UPI002ADF6728|nr:protein SGT1 homolog isoform X4 [Nerophis ophidion]